MRTCLNKRFSGRILITVAAALLPAPAAAELLPRPEDIVLPQEEALLDTTLARLLDQGVSDPTAFLHALDDALVQLDKPTMLRGYVQFLRAGALAAENDVAAREAIDESIRLLPTYSGPLLGAVSIYAYSDRPGPAADYLMRASEIDPDIVRRMPDYEINNIFARLDSWKEDRRARLLGQRLLEIGWLGQSLQSRSNLAMRAIEAKIADGDAASARPLVPKLLYPTHSYALLADNRYRELWPDIERWAGAKLETQWSIYLAEARQKWTSSNDPQAAQSYGSALAAAGHYDTIIRDLLPLFTRALEKNEDYDLVFVAPTVADALARRGRWNDIETLFSSVARIWTLGSEANALNVTANWALYKFYEGKTADALTMMDAAIADASQWHGQVNDSALAFMHQYRACMLHRLGRDDEAAISRLIVAQLEGVLANASLYVCLGKHGAAREVLIGALADPRTRDTVLDFVQTKEEAPMQSEYGRWIYERYEALRKDERLLREIAKYGRVLPFALSEGAPAESPPEKAI